MFDQDDLDFGIAIMPTPQTLGGLLLCLVLVLICCYIVAQHEQDCATNTSCKAPAVSVLLDHKCQCVYPDTQKE